MPGGLAALLDDIAVLAKLAAASVDDVGAAGAPPLALREPPNVLRLVADDEDDFVVLAHAAGSEVAAEVDGPEGGHYAASPRRRGPGTCGRTTGMGRNPARMPLSAALKAEAATCTRTCPAAGVAV